MHVINSISDLALIEDDVIADLRKVRTGSNTILSATAHLATLVFPARQVFDFTDKVTGITRPDFHGQSPEYRAWMSDLMTAAGFISPANAPEARKAQMTKFRNEVTAGVRYQCRKLAEVTLTRQQLLDGGYKYDSRLGKGQKLSEGDNRTVRPPKPVDTDLTNVNGGIIALTNRAGDIRQLDVMKRQALADRFEAAARGLLDVLRPTKAEITQAAKLAAKQAEQQAMLDRNAQAAAAAKEAVNRSSSKARNEAPAGTPDADIEAALAASIEAAKGRKA